MNSNQEPTLKNLEPPKSTTQSGRTPASSARKSVILRVKRDRSVAPPANSNKNNNDNNNNNNITGENAADSTSHTDITTTNSAKKGANDANRGRGYDDDESSDQQKACEDPSVKKASSAEDTIHVRIGGVTYHFARMTEALWDARRKGGGRSKPTQHPQQQKDDCKEAEGDQSKPQEQQGKENKAIDRPPPSQAESRRVPRVNEGENNLPTAKNANNNKEEGETTASSATAAAGAKTDSSPFPSSSSAAYSLINDNNKNNNSNNLKGPKFIAGTDNATIKQKGVDKMSAEAVSRRKLLRLSSVECCRLGLGIGAALAKNMNVKRNRKGGGLLLEDTECEENALLESVLISAVEYSAAKKGGGGGGGGNTTTNAQQSLKSTARSSSSASADRKKLLNAADAGKSNDAGKRGMLGGKRTSDTQSEDCDTVKASKNNGTFLNGETEVKPEDQVLYNVGKQTEAILTDLYSYIMAAEQKALRSRGRSLRDDEMDALITEFKASTSAREKKEREEKERARKEEEELAKAAEQTEEGERGANNDEDETDENENDEFDYYILTHEEEDSYGRSRPKPYGAAGGFDDDEEGFFDGYDLVDESAGGDGPIEDDDEEEVLRGATVASQSIQYSIMPRDASHQGHASNDDEDDDQANAKAAAEHLSYNFETLTLGPHAEESRVRWRNQPMDVVIANGGSSGGGAPSSSSFLQAPDNTNDDDFDFTEVARGPANTYQLQAPTLNDTAPTADSVANQYSKTKKRITFATDNNMIQRTSVGMASHRARLAQQAANHLRDVAASYHRSTKTTHNQQNADEDDSPSPLLANDSDSTAATMSGHQKAPLHADPFANIHALNAWLEEQEVEEANALVPDDEENHYYNGGGGGGGERIVSANSGNEKGKRGNAVLPSNALIMRSFFGPLLGKLKGTNEGDIDGTIRENAKSNNKGQKDKGDRSLPLLPANSKHFRNNIGAEDPEVVFQHDDEYDSNDENHYGNDYADESDDDDDDDSSSASSSGGGGNNGSDFDDDDHDDDRAGLGFGGVPPGGGRRQRCVARGTCDKDIFDFSESSDEDGTDSDNDSFQGYDRYGDLGCARPTSSSSPLNKNNNRMKAGGIRCVGFDDGEGDGDDSDFNGEDDDEGEVDRVGFAASGEGYQYNISYSSSVPPRVVKGERRRTRPSALYREEDDLGGFDDYGRVAHDECCDDVDNYY